MLIKSMHKYYDSVWRRALASNTRKGRCTPGRKKLSKKLISKPAVTAEEIADLKKQLVECKNDIKKLKKQRKQAKLKLN